ncbi:amidohydrolase family protein [Nonomuraea sp. NPDC003201]
MLKIIALEEHLVTAGIFEAWRTVPETWQLYGAATGRPDLIDRLFDLGEARLADMDDQGIDVQVLSVTPPGVQSLGAARAVPLAREANDAVAAAVRAHPGRFEGFATLPTPDPRAAAEELRRAVTGLGLKGAMIHGRTGSRNLDHPDMTPIWEAAAELRCPIYLHSQFPDAPVRDAYYSHLGTVADKVFAGPMVGWHYETGLQLLRLVLAGTFDRFPTLQIITGHWGEVVLFYLDRITQTQSWTGLSLQRPIGDYFARNVSYTGSGILSERYLHWTKEVVGIDRILYATDYPFIDAGNAHDFLDDAALTAAEREAVAHGNWERLTAHLG